MTARMTVTTARMTGKDNDDSRTTTARTTATTARTTTMMAATATAVAVAVARLVGRSVARLVARLVAWLEARSVAWLVAVFFANGCLALTYCRNCTDMFWNKFIVV